MVRNSGSKIKGYDPLVMGVGIEQQDLMNNVGIPNEHDDDAKLFADIGAAAGPNPRGAAALFSGVAKGLEHGARSKSTAKKQAKLERYNKAMDYFREVNRVAAEHKKWYETREFAQQQYLPQVLAYAENVTKLDPQSQRLTAQSILDGWNRTVGDNYKLNSIDGSDPFVMTVSGDDGTQVIDIRTMFAGDDLLQQKLAQKMPEYQLKLQEKREKLQADQNFRQENLELEKAKAGLPNKFQKASNTDAQTQQVGQEDLEFIPLSKLEKTARADYQKGVTKSIKNIPINQQSIKDINEMRDIFERRPDIGNSFINILDSEDENSLLELVKKKLVNQDALADMQRLKKLSNDLNLSVILDAPGKTSTDLFKQAVKAAAPHGKLTKDAFDSIASSWEDKAKRNISLARQGATALNNGQMLIPKDEMQQGRSMKNVVIVDPETGQRAEIPEDKLDAAIAGGWTTLNG